MRKTQARRQRSAIWRLCTGLVPLLLALWGLVILLILMAAPWTAKAIPWWKLFLGGCAATAALLACAVLMASFPDAQQRYAVTVSGVRLGSRLYKWAQIAGYHIEEQLSDNGTKVLRLVLRNRTTRCLQLSPDVSFENVVALVAERVPAVQSEDLAADVTTALTKPVPMVVAVAWGVVGGVVYSNAQGASRGFSMAAGDHVLNWAGNNLDADSLLAESAKEPSDADGWSSAQRDSMLCNDVRSRVVISPSSQSKVIYGNGAYHQCCC
jgi:hypothetical protein